MAAENQPRWQTGRVVEAAPVATGIQRIILQTQNPHRAAPGSHVDVVVNTGGRSDTRSYSVVASSEDGRLLTISVHLAPQSRGGSVFMHRLKPGDSIEMTQPLQNFPLRVGAERYVLLAGGVGITAIAETARVLRRLGSNYLLVYVGRSRDRMAYLKELQQLHVERIRVHVDDEGTSLDAAALVDEVAAAESTELYMCGPIRLMDAIRRRWQVRDLPAANLRYETFGNSGWYEPEEFVVTVPGLGIETTVETGQSILQALERAGVDVMSDCRKGECGLCEAKVLGIQGHVDHRDVFFSDEQKKDSRGVCVCVSRAVLDTATAGVTGTGENAPVATLPTGNCAVLTLDIP